MPIPNDIPVAQRINSPARSATHPFVRSLKALPWWVYILAIVAFFLPMVGMHFMSGRSDSRNANSQKSTAIAPANSSSDRDPGIDPTTGRSSEQIFGHLAYAETPLSSLRVISRASDGYEIRLKEPAAKAFLQMAAVARTNGIELVPISGFRTVDEQKKLFFDISKQRNQTPAQRAMVSAPPGYSEHHTGYAIDIGDGSAPSSNLSPDFDKTEAFRWLESNAAQFGFELSFPKNNPQGVSYEPWHWRYVGDSESLATFYKNQPQSQTSSRR
ncbi:D-alanyl-D-alanine carboxypeptidase family protein [Pseudanabaena sp. PCC 6802]|uniref:M15 family metallopeptidase n=1 Tax=Pseudanabaena sp. PCC 6802 TaxID=118173 RepID=UPI000348B9B4|nr:M15 family metallopeptidase [Pseudanabaena sp. PCC 6802]